MTAGVPREPRFLASSPVAIAAVLARDFTSFLLVLLYYPICWWFGGAAFMFDNLFGTAHFDRLMNVIERLDRKS